MLYFVSPLFSYARKTKSKKNFFFLRRVEKNQHPGDKILNTSLTTGNEPVSNLKV